MRKEYYEAHKVECAKHMKIYRTEHAEELKAKATARRLANIEECKAKQRAYWKKNAADIAIRRRAHYAENSEEILARQKIYYTAHPERAKIREQKYRRSNPEKLSARDANTKAKLWGSPGLITSAQLKCLYRLFGSRCLCCGKKRKLSPDHIVPFSKGGVNDISNIQPLCIPCNKKKYNKIIDFRPKASLQTAEGVFNLCQKIKAWSKDSVTQFLAPRAD